MSKITLNPECAWGGDQEIKRYIDCINYRRQKYNFIQSDKYSSSVQDLDQNGLSIIRNFISIDRLDAVKKEFEDIKQRGELQYNDFYTEQVGHPLASCKSVFDIVFDDNAIEVAKNFFGCVPCVTNVQLRKSKATLKDEINLPGNGQTTRFHCDKDSPRFVKFFFYLNDVGPNNGPFTYVKGSNINKFDGWKSKVRWSDEEIQSIYGQQNMVNCTAKAGDVILGNTNGFHKGQKITEGERMLLTVYYSVNPTEWRSTFGGRIRTEDYEKLPDHKKPLCDYLNRI